MRAVPFYEYLEATVWEEDPSMVEVERIYCLDLDAFKNADWSILERIYRALPGRYRDDNAPIWFGDNEEQPPFLAASAEPTGVQVNGVLPPDAWAEWDHAFRAALGASELPFRAGAEQE